MRPDLSEEEVNDLCKGLKQNAAKVRFLRSLGLKVDRRPDGSPLVLRAQFEPAGKMQPAPNGPRPNWKSPLLRNAERT